MGSYYPAFLDLEGRRCVVIGGGEVAERKVGALLSAGARVTVVSPEATVEIARLAQHEEVVWHRRGYEAGDLTDAWLAIAATDDGSVNRAIGRDAEERRVLLNVVDQPALCNFIAPSVVQRGDLTIAVSTAGKSPAMARKVRHEIERAFPPEYGVLLEVAAEARRELMGEGHQVEPELWQTALSDEVLSLARSGDTDAARARVLKTLRRRTPVAG